MKKKTFTLYVAIPAITFFSYLLINNNFVILFVLPISFFLSYLVGVKNILELEIKPFFQKEIFYRTIKNHRIQKWSDFQELEKKVFHYLEQRNRETKKVVANYEIEIQILVSQKDESIRDLHLYDKDNLFSRDIFVGIYNMQKKIDDTWFNLDVEVSKLENILEKRELEIAGQILLDQIYKYLYYK